jgi:dienelactone hydrolase
LAYYDLHATVEYVKKTTGGSKIIYVGYCMGAISGLIYASIKPEDASKSIQIMITLAPVISYQDAHGPLMTAVAILYKLQVQ